MTDILLHGDCLELMKDVPDNTIDMVLCDLPYGTTYNKWDCLIPLDLLWKEYKRIAKNTAAIILFSQMPFSADLIVSNRNMFRYEWIWIKDTTSGFLNSHHAPLRIHENILVFSKSSASGGNKNNATMSYYPQMIKGKPYRCVAGPHSSNYGKQTPNTLTDCSNGLRYPYDVIQMPTEHTHLHPTQKPVDLLRYLIRTYTNRGGYVLDNCMGSGSTCVAAVMEHRHYIGMEKERKYYDIACKRVKEAKRYPTLPL